MLRKFLSLGLVVLATSSFLGCKKDAPAAPPCYAGRVVAVTCTDGMLIDVDTAYPIGARHTVRESSPAASPTVLGNNVVAVVNTSDYGRLATVGLTLHFNAVNDPNRQSNELQCYFFDGVQGAVPRLVLRNVATTACHPGPL